MKGLYKPVVLIVGAGAGMTLLCLLGGVRSASAPVAKAPAGGLGDAQIAAARVPAPVPDAPSHYPMQSYSMPSRATNAPRLNVSRAPSTPTPSAPAPRAPTPPQLEDRTGDEPDEALAASAPTPADDELRRAALDRHWASEAPDANWSSAAHDYVMGALQDAKLPAERLETVDCRASLCRMQLHFDSDEEGMQLYSLRQPDHDLTFFRNERSLTVFFAREGQQLADISGEDGTGEQPSQ